MLSRNIIWIIHVRGRGRCNPYDSRRQTMCWHVMYCTPYRVPRSTVFAMSMSLAYRSGQYRMPVRWYRVSSVLGCLIPTEAHCFHQSSDRHDHLIINLMIDCRHKIMHPAGTLVRTSALLLSVTFPLMFMMAICVSGQSLLLSPSSSSSSRDLERELQDMTKEELERICVERGFELIKDEIDEETGLPIVSTHQDHVDAAWQCLQLYVLYHILSSLTLPCYVHTALDG
jgi:hypothetical protein